MTYVGSRNIQREDKGKNIVTNKDKDGMKVTKEASR